MAYSSELARLQKAAELHWNRNVLPKTFPYSNWDQFTSKDIARWILLNPQRSLNERIDQHKSVINLSVKDEVALLTAGRYLSAAKKYPLLGLMVPYQSSAFSLLLGFFSLLQAVLDHDYPLGINIPPHAGVMVVSPNSELSSRLLRTHYGHHYLGNIYEILRVKIDGTMEQLDREINIPSDSRWFAMFKASRKELPSSLERQPRLIILDLLPLRLRNRVDELLDWCQSMSTGASIVVVAPEGDIEINERLVHRQALISHLGASDCHELSLAIGRQSSRYSAPLTAAWGIPADKGGLPSIHIHKVLGHEEVEEKFNDVLKLVSSTQHERSGIPVVFRRSQSIAWTLRDSLVSLRHYELLAHEGLSLRSVILSLKNAVPINEWERKIFNTTLPLIVDKLLSIYDLIRQLRLPPKAAVLMNLLHELLGDRSDQGRIVILVPTDQIVTAVATWLDAYLESDRRTKVQVYSIKGYIQRQQVMLTEMSLPSHLILASALPKRHSSLMFAPLASNVHFLTYPKEMVAARIAVQQFYYNRTSWHYSWLQALYLLHELTPDVDSLRNYPPLNITEHVYTLTAKQSTNNFSVELIDPNSLNIDALMEFWTTYNSLTDDDEDMSVIRSSPVQSRFISDASNMVESICIVFDGGARLFLSTKKNQQFFSQISGELMSDTPDKIHRQDFVVSINADAQKDLFNEVVKGTGLTPMMIALQGYLEQWRNVLSKLIYKHSDAYDPYLAMMREIKFHGGSIKSTQSIRSWVEGKTEYLQRRQNVYAVCRAADIDDPDKLADLIYAAMQQLWHFRQSLGRKLNSLIRRQVARLVDSSEDGLKHDDIIEAPGGVRIPLAEVAEALEVYQVDSIESDERWLVPFDWLGWIIPVEQWQQIQGVVRER